ncbi:hypothetical protein H2198_004179 [Neophaeococcomyces mojaviensis]|uniref:Uncharacterized protein n=1 Tax=Neophaeococcomyces mojaviensis TaxID=3383035 RepID=A0ACC3A991_9EURO|nr:hypothetical protein H2198_004179 [Knufia sp. JES_112]
MHEQNEVISSDVDEEDRGVASTPPLKRRKTGHSPASFHAREVGLMRDGTDATSASFVGSASGIYFIRSVYGAVGLPSTGKTSPENTLVPGEEDRLTTGIEDASLRSIWRNQEVGNSVGEEFSFDEIVHWTSSYFDAWHPAFPFLHAPTVLENLEKSAQGFLGHEHSWDKTTIKALVSISLADRRQSGQRLPRPISPSLVFETYDAALDSIQPAVTRPATISSLQAVICVQLFLVSMLRLNAASRLGGLVVRMAFQLGLHRCPNRFPSFSQEQQSLRKRIFWTVYCIERHICQALGLPLTIRDDDVDVCRLNQEVHGTQVSRLANHEADGAEISEENEANFDPRLQLLSFLARHAEIRGSIMELRNKTVAERDKNRSTDIALLINSKLTQWCHEVDDFLDEVQFSSSSFSRLHKSVLQTSKNECTIAMNRPLLASPKNTVHYTAAVHACIGAAKSIITTLYELLEPVHSSDHSVCYTPMAWPSFTWAVWMSAFIILYGAAEGQCSTQVASRHVTRSLQILERLALRGSVWPNACSVAIKDLKSSLSKRHVSSGQLTANLNRDEPHNASKQISQQQSGARPQTVSRSDAQDNGLQRRLDEHSSVLRGTPGSTSQEVPQTGRVVKDGFRNGANSQKLYASNAGIGSGQSVPFANSQLRDPIFDRTAFPNIQQPFMSTESMQDFWAETSLLPADVPPLSFGPADPLQGFDIPFWLGEDNYLAWMGNGG